MKNALPMLADFADGIFAVILAAYITSTEIVWWYFFVGVLLAMSPDLDAISEFVKRGKVSTSNENTYDHREGLHFPIVFVVLGIAAAQQFGFWGYVFLLATTLHFVNDLYGTGWGIPLLWPFTKRRYKLLGRRVNRLKKILIEDGDWETLPHDERRLRIIVSWSDDELQQYFSRWGVDDWIDRWYLDLNWISGIEFLLFVVSILLVLKVLIY